MDDLTYFAGLAMHAFFLNEASMHDEALPGYCYDFAQKMVNEGKKRKEEEVIGKFFDKNAARTEKTQTEDELRRLGRLK